VASLLADECLSNAVIDGLRRAGHDVLTVRELGLAYVGTPDETVMQRAIELNRTVLTMDERHYRRLHRVQPVHSGIVVFNDDGDRAALVARLDQAIGQHLPLDGRVLHVPRPPRQPWVEP
jgi:predicted nuclease of predicted toxin-antitoxin system